MTDFQVGDRVSVEGVVNRVNTITVDVAVEGDPAGVFTFYVPKNVATLVERPRRKLRVGSVWEYTEGKDTRYLYMGNNFFMDLRLGKEVPRHELLLEKPGHEDSWREIPVEELEQEAE